MSIIKYISICDRYTKMYLDKVLQQFKINSSQYMYIIHICQNPGMTQDQFMNCFYLHPSNITRSLSSLEKAGFILKTINDDDKRTCRLYPTDKAHQAYHKIDHIIQKCEEQLLEESLLEKDELEGIVKRLAINAMKMNKEREDEHG